MPKKKMKAKKSAKPKKAKPAKKKAAKKTAVKKKAPTKKKPAKAKAKPKPKPKPAPKAKPAAKKPTAKPVEVPPAPTGARPVPPKGGVALGRVVHYYDRIMVAIVTLTGKLSVGDKILFKRGEREFLQKIKSIQVHHEPLQTAGAGQVVGLKVDNIAPEGTWLLRP